VTPKVIRNLIVAIWVTAGALSLPGYLGFVWPDPATCIATLWPKFETAVEVCLYAVSCTLVVFVYTRIWNEVMHGEVQQQQLQQQQTNRAAVTTSGTTSQSGRRGNAEHGIRVLWHHRRLIRKQRATRTTMVILGYRHDLVTPDSCSNYTTAVSQPAPSWSFWSASSVSSFRTSCRACSAWPGCSSPNRCGWSLRGLYCWTSLSTASSTRSSTTTFDAHSSALYSVV